MHHKIKFLINVFNHFLFSHKIPISFFHIQPTCACCISASQTHFAYFHRFLLIGQNDQLAQTDTVIAIMQKNTLGWLLTCQPPLICIMLTTHWPQQNLSYRQRHRPFQIMELDLSNDASKNKRQSSLLDWWRQKIFGSSGLKADGKLAELAVITWFCVSLPK